MPTLLSRIHRHFFGSAMEMRRSQLAALPLPPRRALFLGDSITEGGNWAEWFPDLQVVNRGIGGDTIGGVLRRLDSCVNDPMFISLLIGTNDLGGLGISTKPAHVASQFSELVAELRHRAPDTPLIITSVMPRKRTYAAKVRELNESYKTIAQRSGARYLDLWPVLADADGAMRTEFTGDDLHLNGPGYKAWVGELRPLLDELLRESTGTPNRA